MIEASSDRFQSLFDRPAGAVYAELASAYGQPIRRYHTLGHIADCLSQLADISLSGRDLWRVEAALWWHDVIYDPTRRDNEAESAALSRSHLAVLGVEEDDRVEVARLIDLTKGHRVDEADDVGAALVSIDLSILGRSPEVYERYAAAIRSEYQHVLEDAYRAGRAAVMTRFLETPIIYADPDFRDRFEAQARTNIAAEIASLTAVS